MKMSDENIGYCLQQLAGYEPSDIDCDDFEIAVNDDQFASMSIVRLAALASESHDKLVSDLAESQAEVERLRESLKYFLEIPPHPRLWISEYTAEALKAHKLLLKAHKLLSEDE